MVAVYAVGSLAGSLVMAVAIRLSRPALAMLGGIVVWHLLLVAFAWVGMFWLLRRWSLPGRSGSVPGPDVR